MNARTLIVGLAALLILAGGAYIVAVERTPEAPLADTITVTRGEPPAATDAVSAPPAEPTPEAETAAAPSGAGSEEAGAGSGQIGTGSPASAGAPSPEPADPPAAGFPTPADTRPVPAEAPELAEAGASQDPTPEAVLRAASRAYEGVRSIRAGFEQQLENALLGRTTYSTGILYQRQPDLFRMEFSEPAGDLIVSDGEYFWTWYPSVDSTQVLRTARGAGGLDLRSQFIGDPVRRFETTYHGTDAVAGRPAHVMTLVPRDPAGFTRLKVWIDETDHLVRRFDLTESNGNVRHFVLSGLAVNTALVDDLFRFTPPPGARVVTR